MRRTWRYRQLMSHKRSSNGLMALLRLAVTSVAVFRPPAEFGSKVGERYFYIGVSSLIREPQTVDWHAAEIPSLTFSWRARTECCCQWVARMMAAIVAPSVRPSIASTRACFEPGRLSCKESALVFALSG